MPHVVFLHSHLTQGRIPSLGPEQARRVFHFEAVDVVIAMTLAGLVNAAMLIMAAATFNANGYAEIASIEDAHATLDPAARTGVGVRLRHLAAGLGPVVFDGRHDGRAGGDAGLPAPHAAALGAAAGHAAAGATSSSPSAWTRPARWSSAR